MKLTSALLLPFLLVASSASMAIAAPSPGPNPAPAGGEEGIKVKIAQLGVAITPREPGETSLELEARANVQGRVNTNGVRYRRCPRTSCDAIGQYNSGQIITIRCRVQGESINGWNWWDLMTNGYYISDYYVDWTGGVPDIC